MITDKRKQEAVVLIRSDKKPIYIGGLISHPVLHDSGVGPVAYGFVTQTYQMPKVNRAAADTRYSSMACNLV